MSSSGPLRMRLTLSRRAGRPQRRPVQAPLCRASPLSRTWAAETLHADRANRRTGVHLAPRLAAAQPVSRTSSVTFVPESSFDSTVRKLLFSLDRPLPRSAMRGGSGVPPAQGRRRPRKPQLPPASGAEESLHSPTRAGDLPAVLGRRCCFDHPHDLGRHLKLPSSFGPLGLHGRPVSIGAPRFELGTSSPPD